MMRHKGWIILVPLSVLVLLVLSAVAVGGLFRDVAGFGLRETYNLDSGAERDGDQVIFGYEVNLEPASVINGQATLIGNKVNLGAEVDGDVVVIADRLAVNDAARIAGDLTVCANKLAISDRAKIAGEVNQECSEGKGVSVSNLIGSGWDGWRENFYVRLGSTIAGALLFGALAALGTLFFRQPLSCMSHSMRRAPFATGGFGCLTILVALGLTGIYLVSLLLVLPLILMPLAVFAWLVIGLLCLLGWLALAEPFGRRIMTWLGIDDQPAIVAAAVGGITLALLVRVWGLFWFTSWIGLLLTGILGSIGLGAVVLTRVGTRPFPQSEAVSRLAANH